MPTGEQLFFKYQDNGPEWYASVLLTIYMALGNELFPLLLKAESENKKISIRPNVLNGILRDITVNDVIFE